MVTVIVRLCLLTGDFSTISDGVQAEIIQSKEIGLHIVEQMVGEMYIFQRRNIIYKM